MIFIERDLRINKTESPACKMRLFCQHVVLLSTCFRQPRASKEALIRAHLHLLAYPHIGVQPVQINLTEGFFISLIGTFGKRENTPNKNIVWRQLFVQGPSSVRNRAICNDTRVPFLSTRLQMRLWRR